MDDTGKKEKHAGGRPDEFKPVFADQAMAMCSMGATSKQLADFFGVSIATIYNWRSRYPEFLEALKVAKDAADSLVERSLYEKALAGDTTAQIFWLKNRKRAEWRDRIDHNVTGQLTTMTDDEINARSAELLAKAQLEGK